MIYQDTLQILYGIDLLYLSPLALTSILLLLFLFKTTIANRTKGDNLVVSLGQWGHFVLVVKLFGYLVEYITIIFLFRTTLLSHSVYVKMVLNCVPKTVRYILRFSEIADTNEILKFILWLTHPVPVA